MVEQSASLGKSAAESKGAGQRATMLTAGQMNSILLSCFTTRRLLF